MERNEPQRNTKIASFLKRVARLQAICGLGLLLVWLILGPSGWILAIACVFVLGSAVCSGWYLPKLVQEEVIQVEERGRRETLRILSNYRHDVMNHVQLIKGYMQLQKLDRLQGPLQKLVTDAHRHSAISNLPGTVLPFQLIQRDLSAPMMQLTVEVSDGADNWDSEYELMLLEAIRRLANAGEELSQELGIPVEWVAKFHRENGKLAISLHVLGEHVNDTYIEDVIAEFAGLGFRLQKQSKEEQQYILSFGS